MVELSAGLKVRTDVELVAPLGSGGMGRVWRARHHGLETDVAVKFLFDEGASDGARARFLQEARAAAQVKSPHVVQILDQGSVGDDTPYIIMELLSGETLATRLARLGRIPPAEVCTLLGQLAIGLDAGHHANVIHRDVKPANVFIVTSPSAIGDEEGPRVKLIDFGVAKRAALPDADRLTGGGTMLGTPFYMSPEQVMNARAVGAGADLWALAVIAYEMLCGQPPFTGNDLGEFCAAVLTGQYTPISGRVPGLPEEIDAWFARTFDREEGRRFRSATEMIKALRKILPAGPLDARTLEGAATDAPPRVRRRATPQGHPAPRALPWLLGGATLAAVVALVVHVQRSDGEAAGSIAPPRYTSSERPDPATVSADTDAQATPPPSSAPPSSSPVTSERPIAKSPVAKSPGRVPATALSNSATASKGSAAPGDPAPPAPWHTTEPHATPDPAPKKPDAEGGI